MVCLLLLGVVACRAPRESATSEASAELPQTPLPFLLPHFVLTDQWEGGFGTEELGGKVWVASFFSAECGTACGLLTSSLRAVQEEIAKADLESETQLVTFTISPESDTPQSGASLLRDLGADGTQWRFLTGTGEEIAPLLLDGFGLKLSSIGERAATWLGHVALIDRAGRVRELVPAAEEGSGATIMQRLRLLLSEPLLVAQPPDVMAPSWVEKRRNDQIRAARDYEVFHDFRFEDHRPESGITFRHQFVEDLGPHFKEVHYDHGNGVAVADVDLDGYLDLYFTTQLGSNELWINRGNGTFENAAASAAVGAGDRISVAPAFADIDNDGDPDLFVTTVRGGNLLFENDGTGSFTDISASSGVGHVGHSSGAGFFDYDDDGLLDLFVTNVGRYTTDRLGPGGYYVGYQRSFDGHLIPERSETSLLYRNLGGNRFADKTEATGLLENGWNGDLHVLDLNRDGWLDLYLIDMQGHDQYWQNFNGQRFARRSRELFPATSFGSMGIAVFDFDNDGLMDIYTVDMHTDMFDGSLFDRIDHEKRKLPKERMPTVEALGTDGNHVRGNAFFHNRGDGRFEEISDQIGAETYWPWGLSTGDLNADGFEDVFIASSMNYPFRYHPNSVLLNENGKRFRDSEYVLGIEPRRNGQTATPWFELDCPNEDREHELCAQHDGPIEVWGALGTRSSVIFDLDDDGDLDIVTNDFGSAPMVLVSDLSERKSVHFVKIRLVGSESNRQGIGARVTVRAGDLTLTKVQTGKSGYLAQSDSPLYFGLGEAESLDSVEVEWPSGRAQAVGPPLAINRLLEIREP